MRNGTVVAILETYYLNICEGTKVMNISLDQLTTSARGLLKTPTVDDHAKDNENDLSIQNRYVDSIELSDRAIGLSTQAGAEMGIKEQPDTNQRQQREDTGTNQQQGPDFTKAVSLNVLA